MSQHAQIDEAVRMLGGPAAMPPANMPILLMDEHSRVTTVILTDGVTEMAEIAEVAHRALERRENQIAATGQAFDFEAARHRAGMPSASSFDANLRNAITDRIAKHHANPVSDPPRQPEYFDDYGNRTTERPHAPKYHYSKDTK